MYNFPSHTHKGNPGKDKPPSEEIDDIIRPFPEKNMSDGSEFLDDAIRMNEQPFETDETKENESNNNN